MHMNPWNLIQPTDDDKKRILIALETLDIIRQGFYQKGDIRIQLRNDQHCNLGKVIPYSPESLDRMRTVFSVRACTHNDKKPCSIRVEDSDSLQAAIHLDKPLVLNFANARRPGGGFLYGARAQEESLCRASSLYASISASPSKQMYDYNRERNCPVDSDYMLLSPDVCVFRDADGGLLDVPYYVSVLTVPAPDRNGSARTVSPTELTPVIKRRLRNVFVVASLHGYRSLVLGAWGCGAFGNDPYAVAECFRELLIDEQYGELFDDVVFAVLKDAAALDAFRKQLVP